MLNPENNQSMTPGPPLGHQIMSALIQIRASSTAAEEKYESNQKQLVLIRQEVQRLRMENQGLSQLQRMLNESCQLIQEDHRPIIDPSAVVQDEQKVMDKQQHCHEQQVAVQVILPHLANLQGYFKDLICPQLVDKYLAIQQREKEEQMKHAQQVAKLQQKLANVDSNVNSTLAALKNQRRQF